MNIWLKEGVLKFTWSLLIDTKCDEETKSIIIIFMSNKTRTKSINIVIIVINFLLQLKGGLANFYLHLKCNDIHL